MIDTTAAFDGAPASLVGAPSAVLPRPGSAAIAPALAAVLVPALLGLYLADRRRTRLDRAERVERERALLLERAHLRERADIADEAHDVLAHRIGLMVLQAGALRTRARDRDVRARAEELRLAGCRALEELRALVAVTGSGRRAGSVPDAPQEMLDVSDLVADARSAGVSVDLITLGAPRATSSVVGRAARRVVQEALTNVRRHAPGAVVGVRLQHMGDEVRIAVRNSAAGRAAEVAPGPGGSGLLGLRKRVELMAGTLRTGPLPDGGYELLAVLPAGTPTSTTTGEPA
jgi:signal transduction histidine kinase